MMAARSPPDDRVDKWPPERILADLEEQNRAEAAAGPEGRATLRADGSGDEADIHQRRQEEQLAVADPDPLHVGDHVNDAERDGGPTMLVKCDTGERADEHEIEIDGVVQTVAQANPDCEPDERVYEVVFPQRTDVDLDQKQPFAYPRSRLEVEERIHDVDSEVSE